MRLIKVSQLKQEKEKIYISWDYQKESLNHPSVVVQVIDNSCLPPSLLLHEDRAVCRRELYIKYMMNAGGMKDNVF